MIANVLDAHLPYWGDSLTIDHLRLYGVIDTFATDPQSSAEERFVMVPEAQAAWDELDLSRVKEFMERDLVTRVFETRDLQLRTL